MTGRALRCTCTGGEVGGTGMVSCRSNDPGIGYVDVFLIVRLAVEAVWSKSKKRVQVTLMQFF